MHILQHVQPVPHLAPSLLTSIQMWIFTGSTYNCMCKDRSGSREGLCLAMRSWTTSHELTNPYTPLEPEAGKPCSYPSIRAWLGIVIFPVPALTALQLSFPAHLSGGFLRERKKGGDSCSSFWALNRKHPPSNQDREKYCCDHFPYPNSWEPQHVSACTFPWYRVTWPAWRVRYL